MTEAQDQVLKTVCLKLGEHFDGFIVVTRISVDDNTTQHHLSYEGGFYAALGLLQIATADLIERGKTPRDEE